MIHQIILHSLGQLHQQAANVIEKLPDKNRQHVYLLLISEQASCSLSPEMRCKHNWPPHMPLFQNSLLTWAVRNHLTSTLASGPHTCSALQKGKEWHSCVERRKTAGIQGAPGKQRGLWKKMEGIKWEIDWDFSGGNGICHFRDRNTCNMLWLRKKGQTETNRRNSKIYHGKAGLS